MQRRLYDCVILLAVSTGMALAIVVLSRASAPSSPARLAVMDDVVAGRSIAYTPFPVGYLEFAGLLIRLYTVRGLIVAQAALYALTVFFSYGTLLGLGVRGWAPVLGALAVALYPNLFLSVTRVQDT